MTKNDAKAFHEALDGLMTLYGRDSPSKTVLRLWWESLSEYDLDAVLRAFSRYTASKEGKFPPLPATVLPFLEGPTDTHPSTDEAWAIAVDSMDEAETVVVTNEIMTARASAQAIWNSGDRIGARMAFRAAYERAVNIGPAKPRWRLNAGWDTEKRAMVAQQAMEQGKLTKAQVQGYLQPPALDPDMKLLAGAVLHQEGNVVGFPQERREEIRKILAEAREAREAKQREVQAKIDREIENRQRRRYGDDAFEKAKAQQRALDEKFNIEQELPSK